MFLREKILKRCNKGLMTGMILIDLQKVFDTIDQDIPLKKLRTLKSCTITIDMKEMIWTNQ